MFFDMQDTASRRSHNIIIACKSIQEVLDGAGGIPLIPCIGHRLSAAGLSNRVSHLTTQLFQQLKGGNGYIGVKLVDVAGDKEGDVFILNHKLMLLQDGFLWIFRYGLIFIYPFQWLFTVSININLFR
jgi:hypothetical protein